MPEENNNFKKPPCGNGIRVTTQDGIEIDPHLYEEIETHYNCTVHVLRCKECGHIEIEWDHAEKENDDE